MAVLAAGTVSIVSTVIISLILIGAVVMIVRHLRRQKKQGVGFCGCDCAHCSMGCGQSNEISGTAQKK